MFTAEILNIFKNISDSAQNRHSHQNKSVFEFYWIAFTSNTNSFGVTAMESDVIGFIGYTGKCCWIGSSNQSKLV